MKNTLITMAVGLIGWAGVGVFLQDRELSELKQPAPKPVAPINTNTTDSEWTNAKQVVYNGCMSEAVGQEYYCSCIADYMIDTYGIETVANWGNSGQIPQKVVDVVLERCL